MGSMVSSVVFMPPFYVISDDMHAERQSNALVIADEIQAYFFDHDFPITLIFSHGNAEDINTLYD